MAQFTGCEGAQFDPVGPKAKPIIIRNNFYAQRVIALSLTVEINYNKIYDLAAQNSGSNFKETSIGNR